MAPSSLTPSRRKEETPAGHRIVDGVRDEDIHPAEEIDNSLELVETHIDGEVHRPAQKLPHGISVGPDIGRVVENLQSIHPVNRREKRPVSPGMAISAPFIVRGWKTRTPVRTGASPSSRTRRTLTVPPL